MILATFPKVILGFVCLSLIVITVAFLNNLLKVVLKKIMKTIFNTLSGAVKKKPS